MARVDPIAGKTTDKGTVEMLTPEELQKRLDRFERVPLSHLPTPLDALPRLSRRVGWASIYLKRDDQTGLAFGGNKARKLEFIMGDVMNREVDSVVTWAGIQSNWCRQVAAATARAGLRSVLVLLKKPGMPVGEDGNLLLDRILDADVRVVEAPGEKGFLELEHVKEYITPVVEEEVAAGRTPYLAPVGGSLLEGDMQRPLGALGYVKGFLEMFEQAKAMGFVPDAVVLATGSAGTQAGLLVGAKLTSPDTRIVGVSVAGSTPVVSGYVRQIAEATLSELGVAPEVMDEEVVVFDDYIGDGYGVMNQAVADGLRLMAGEEGILLDPVYTGKALTGLMDLGGKGYFGEGKNLIFLHTGGTPALFPYREEILGRFG
jgi:D-cysteine desulfhydrase family pyridoxal phosphate-dependent enzyme